MSDSGRICRIDPKPGAQGAAGATIGTRPMHQHGLKQPVSLWRRYWHQLFRENLRLTARPRVDPIVALKYYIEGGKLVVKSVRRSEMYLDDDEQNPEHS